jgi:hypothetical protein
MNRYYGNSMGRFLTPDPFGGSGKPTIPQTWNRYAYVANDPVNLTDRSGLDPYGAPDIGFSATFAGWMAVWMAGVAGPGFQSMGAEGQSYFPLLTSALTQLGNPAIPAGSGARTPNFEELVDNARSLTRSNLSAKCQEIFKDLETSVSAVNDALDNKSIVIDGSISSNLVQVPSILSGIFGPKMEPALEVFRQYNSYAFTYSHEIYLNGQGLLGQGIGAGFVAALLMHEALHLPALGLGDSEIIDKLNGVKDASGRSAYHLTDYRSITDLIFTNCFFRN